MDTEATLFRARVNELEDALFQADFYVSQAMDCQAEQSREAILRITRETLKKALGGVPPQKLIDL
ncbi:hypothetical protein [Hyphomicrobium sp.]|uniref:hypothetical protein n=1 Tax=Hyphomicrobium sp. TaxID=82 RepID=UPI002D793FE3|nr:hypothetical protein [Hyphomicrobium sp.]HET6389792.1 hypothetical protein [Hyphomicrobium sp.]